MMGCMLRSEKLSFCEMYLQPEAAFQILSVLGSEGIVQFEDMTPNLAAFMRHYTTDMCRCAELERILIYIEGEIKKDKLIVNTMVPNDPPPLQPEELNAFETLLEKWEENTKDMSNYQSKLLENQQQLQEMYYVLKNIDPIIGQAEIMQENLFSKSITTVFQCVMKILYKNGDENNKQYFILLPQYSSYTVKMVFNRSLADRLGYGGGEPMLGGKLHIVTGVVRRSKAYAFETMLWRISRGNIFFRPANQDQLFEDPQTGTMIRKVAFLAVCQGDRLKVLLEKVSVGFHAHMFECPNTYNLRQEMLIKLDQRILDLTQVIQKSKFYRCKQLRQIGKQIDVWLIRIKKAKSIYFCMNLFSMDITRKCLIGQCWIPTTDLIHIQNILDTCSAKSGSKVGSFLSKVDTKVTPPTFHRTNKFTRGFQGLISAYGDSIYGELNPGLYTIITFPFLFAIMFGDCGHALIMLTFAAWMVIKEKAFMKERSTNEIWNIFFGGRYVILIMSLFSMYTGFLYNDFFSKPLHLKPNYWLNTYTQEILTKEASLQLDPAGQTGPFYIIGVDPVWELSSNKIMNENSLKMKLSIIIGITHMMFGLWLSLFNHIHFKKYYAIIFEFIPQLIILTSLFVWLVALVFVKWVFYGPKKTDIQHQPTCAPSILILFIDMCLFRATKLADSSECKAYMFSNQELIQKVLVVLAMVNIPILLFGSPVYLNISNKKKRLIAEDELDEYLYNKTQTNDEDAVDIVEQHLIEQIEHYSESFSELMIHQGVHTIEYVLSTISHTASYLRLWALSLAHAQLSEMLWAMVLSKLALSDHTWLGCVKLFIIFAVWASFSLSILVLMEGLSAFLHTLRLHWVEFMSKFFLGGGKIFHPYSFNECLYGENKDEKAMEVGCKKRKAFT